MTTDPTRLLAIQTEAVKRLLSHLRAEGHDADQELIADTIEGETSLHDAIGAVFDRIDLREAVALGLEAKIEQFKDRLAATEKAIAFDRAAIEQAMISAEQDSIMLPTATVFVSKRKRGLVVENEADIPSEFFVTPETPAPRLDKKALAAAISAGRTIPGASLDNGSVSLSVRRK